MDSVRLSGSIVSKEGFLYKKGGIIKSWSRRYFVLSPQSLCYFRSETHEKLEPLGRIFLSDIVDISTESTEKKKAFVFVLTTKKRAVLLQGANNEDRHKWVEAIKRAAEHDKEAESKDPFRKSLRRLTPGVKRVTLFKDPTRGIGCTIKNAAGHIFVNRILEDGPIAETGILRPGDEILDIHGVSVFNKTVAEVVDIIRQCPTEFLATVRPIASVQKALRTDFRRINYSDVVHKPISNGHSPKSGRDQLYDSVDSIEEIDGSCEYAQVKRGKSKQHESPTFPPRTSESPPSFEDVGNYDDEDEGDVPPPLPRWTEDALILVDPPPSRAEPKFNIYKTNAHLYPLSNGKYPGTPDRISFGRKKISLHGNSSPPKNSPSPSRRSPPNFPPPALPGKLLKCRSQDALDKIDSRPPVPPRLKNPERGYRSPGSKPRNGHLYNDCTYNRRLPVKAKQLQSSNDYDDVETFQHHDVKYADLNFSRSCAIAGR